MTIMQTEGLAIAYGDTVIVDELNLSIKREKITSIIGPNGCGKSTILKAMSRIIDTSKGSIYLDGKAISTRSNIEIAKKMAILPQTPVAPNGLTVEELVAYGRYPHQKGFRKLNDNDKEKINKALEMTGTLEFKDRDIDTLSGGQRQRVWIAMALAQDTELILLDEPTTYLDLVHQLEVLQLLQKLNKEEKRTIVMVIHEINMASRFSDYMVTIKKGKIIKEGTPEEIMTREVMREVFSIDAYIIKDPRTGKLVCASYEID